MLSANLIAEAARASGSESTLTNNLGNEVTRATAAEGTLTTNLNAEATRASGSETTLTNNLGNELTRATAAESTLTTNLAAEATRATGAESTLTTNLTTENTNRTNADALKEDLANKSTSVTTDGTSDTKYPSVKSVKTYVDASATSGSTALATEITNRTSADETLTTNLNAEATRASGSETTLTNNLGNELTRATAAESTLTTNLATEVTNRTSADETLTTNLSAEATRATAAESTLTTNLATEVTNRTNADALKEDLANKSTNVTTDGTSDTKYPSVKSVKTYVDANINTINTLANGRINIGSATNQATQVAISGDATITNAGVLTISSNAVTNAKLAGGIDLETKVTGTLPIGNGGTGVTTSTGTGNVVLSNSPILVTPVIGAATGTSLSVTGSLTSTIATGTAPLVVTSTTPVTNLSIGGNAATATNATNTGITEDVATATAVYPTWVTANTGNLPQKVSSTKISFVPSTGILTATGFAGNGEGLTGITSATNANLTGMVTSTGNATTVVTNANLTGDVTSSGNATAIAPGVIINADVNASAAIDGTKINPNFGAQTLTLGIGTGATAGTIVLNDAATGTSLTATLQAPATVTATSKTITLPDATGTVALTSDITSGTATNFSGSLSGDVTGTQSATAISATTVTGKLLTGYASGAGTVAATDNILQAIQKLNGNNATNANLTGPITSSGNTTSVASQTGTGSTFVMNTSPTLVTPVLGVATATSVNSTSIPASKTLVVTTDKLNVLAATTSAELAGVISDETGTGTAVFATSPTLVTPLLGTPTSGVMTNVTGTAAGLTAGNATNTGITNDVTTATAVYPTWVTANTGNLPQKVSSTKISFVPSTGILTATGFAGNGSALTNITSATNANLTGMVTSTGNATTVVTNANLTGDVTSSGNATAIAPGVIVNADVNASAAIDGTKINPNFGAQTLTLGTGAGATAGTIVLNDAATGTSLTATLQAPATVTLNRTITLPDATGTVALTSDITSGTATNFSGSLSGDVTGTQSATAISATTVTEKLLTGFVSGAGTVAATDNILQAINKLNGNNATNANLTGPITSVGNTTSIASQTGTGSTFVMNTSPTLVTPVLGVATATSVNSTSIPTSKTLVVTTDKLNVLAATTSAELAGVISDETGTGTAVFATSPTLVTPLLGTPTSGVMTNVTGTAAGLTAGNATNTGITNDVTTATAVYPTWVTANTGNLPQKVSSTKISFVPSTGILTATGFAGNGSALTNITSSTNANLTGAVTSSGNATSLGTFTSANLSGAVSDETGSGVAVFAISPTLVTPALGTPSALIGTNITGTAAGLTAGNVTTNANLTGEVTSSGNATTVNNAAVIGKVLTGYTSGAGTVVATDNILQAIQKLNGNNATNANLTGAITSSGNATSLGSFSSGNLSGALSDKTGTGTAVFATSPTLVTPVLGVATATSVNSTSIPTSKTLVVTTDKLNVLAATTSAELAGVISDETGTGVAVFATSPSLVTPLLGTPTSGVMTNVTGTATGLTAGNATNTGITEDVATAIPVYPTWVTANTGNMPQKVTSTKLSYIPSTGILTSTGFAGSGAGLTGIPNSSFTNSSMTIGSTAISLGNSSTTLAGLTSVTSTGFTGVLTGNVTGNVSGTAANVTGIVAIANGGTNSSLPATAGGVGYGTGTAHAYTVAGTSGQVLTSAAAGIPTWTTPTTGTVTSVSTAAANNGVTATWSTASPTPALTIGLGAITPSSVSATGTVSGSNLSGTNTGDETTATIKTKLGAATTTADGYLTTGDWNAFNGKTTNATHTGDATGSTALTLATVNANIGTYNGITVNAKGLVTGATSGNYATGGGTATGSNTGDQTITLTGGVTGSGTGSFAATVVTNANLTGDITSVGNTTTIVANVITNADLNTVATATIKGRVTTSTGNVEDLTATQVRTLLNVADGATNYTHPTGDGNLHVIATSTTNNGKVLTAGATAGSMSWTTPTTGTITSVAALTLGTTGTDVTSSVATGTTTPVITLNIPTASAANRGALSAADWTTFNGKQAALGFTPYNATNPNNYIALTGLSSTATGLTYTNTTGVFSLTSGYYIPTTTDQTNWNKYNQWDGGSTGLTAGTGRTSLGGTTIGQSMFTLVNPSAITFPRLNADNTVSALDAATFRTAIGAGTSSATGTVTSASVVTANGISGSVATATTTPAITLTLGAITPASVAATSTISGTQLTSTIATGTAPLVVTSTTPVTNLSIGGNAATATNTGITEDVATATSVYPTWVTANTGNLPQKVSSTKISFVPSTGILTATGFAGSGAGLTGITSATNANLSGPITSSGNTTSVASQTGTGSKFVMDTAPTLVTPILGVATATSVNGTSIPTSKTLVVTTDKLNVLAATTSAELAGIISDETGTGSVVLAVSPALTGVPTAPTAAAATNTTQLATTAFVTAAASSLNFVDLTTAQTIAGVKTFSANMIVNGIKVGTGSSGNSTNTAVGSATLSSNTGIENTAIGSLSLTSNISGVDNTAVGYHSLTKNTASNNTAVGVNSSENNTTGVYNSAFGVQALQANISGDQNTAIGVGAIDLMTAGNDNVAIGFIAGQSNITGNNVTTNSSILIGAYTKTNGDNQTNQIVIGHGAIGNGSNTIQLGNTSVTSVNTSGSYTGGSFVKSGGTSSEFLKANGTVDGTAYAPLASPTLTGTPTAPTATAGNNTTALATTAFVTASVAAVTIQNAYPIGSIYLSTISTNPATSLGFGTWVSFGAGRVLLGSGSGYVAGDTGGSAHAAVVDHNHTFTGAALPVHNHNLYRSDAGYGGGGADYPIADPNTGNTGNSLVNAAIIATSAGTPSGVVGNTGLSGYNANLQPYIVVYMWNRIN